MKKIFNYALATMLVLSAAASCTKDVGGADNNSPTDGANTITFALPAQNPATAATTRAGEATNPAAATRAGEAAAINDDETTIGVAGTKHESYLNLAHTTILMYDDSGNFESSFSGDDITVGRVGNNKTATIKLGEYTGAKKFYMVANTNLGGVAAQLATIVKDDATTGVDSYLQTLLTTQQGTTAAPTQILSQSGMILAGTVSESAVQTVGILPIKMGRAVARFDINHNTQGDQVVINRIDFKKANLAGNITAFTDPASIPDLTATQMGDYVGATRGFAVAEPVDGLQEQASAFYIYPNIIKDDNSATEMTIEGKVGVVTKTFRLKFPDGVSEFRIEANKRYKISVFDINTLTFTIEVAEWDEGTSLEGESTPTFVETLSGTPTNCAYDPETKTLTVTDPSAAFACEFNVTSNSSTMITPVSETLRGTPVAITYTVTNGTLTRAAAPSYEHKLKIEGAAGHLEGYSVMARIIDPYNPGNATDINIVSASKGESANSYMIDITQDANQFYIPIDQALKAWDTKLGGVTELKSLLSSGNWEVVTLWRTWGGTTDADKVTAQKYTANDGTNDLYFAKLNFGSSVANGENAVMALRSTVDQTIYWSWHLWLTDYKPGADGTAVRGQVHQYFGDAFKSGGIYENKFIMDRNLGATATGISGAITPPATAAEAIKYYGMMYQWGRKDPFTSANEVGTYLKIYDADGAEITGGIGGFTYQKLADDLTHLKLAAQNPMNYYQNSTTNSWTAHDNTLWGAHATATDATVVLPTSTNKSLFDPCPAGWRVPVGGQTATNNPWAGFNGRPNNPITSTSYSSSGTSSADTESGFMSGTSFPFQYYSAGSNAAANGGWSNAASAATNGRYYNSAGTAAWYPVSGIRGSSSGSFSGVGTGGYNWSSSVTGASGNYLTVQAKDVNPGIGNNRAIGSTVRCVQD